MKKLFTTSLFIFLLAQSYAQFEPLTVTYPSSVDLFDMFEASFKLPMSYANPYDPDTILVYGVFIGPNSSSDTVHAFYYEGFSFQQHNNGYELATRVPSDDSWRIRFTPTQTGTWNFKVRAFNVNGEVTASHLNVNYTFTCNSISSGEGFISKANSRYLKRDMVRKGHRIYGSFFPVGPNIAWYSCKYDAQGKPLIKYPKGIYDYEKYIDSLDGNANYMRIFLNRFQYLSLYGPEYALDTTQTIVYFDSTLNQKDAAELDHIVAYAQQHGVTIMPCMFNYGAFVEKNNQESSDSTIWANNPFNNTLELQNPCCFFTDPEAIRITKNLIRYIVSRWGYATNIVSWEFWNEVSNMFGMCDGEKHIEQDVRDWHEEMAAYVARIDPFNHCITTSIGNNNNHPYLNNIIYNNLDFAQQHKYGNIQKAKSKEQLSYVLYQKTDEGHTNYPSLPFFMGEFGFGQGDPSPSYSEKDHYGIDLHNSLWSSLFSTSIGPASFWWWHYLKNDSLFYRYEPILRFCENLPILSESFTANLTGKEVGTHKLVFPNNLETYYMINATEDTIYGWAQDTAFAYQSLRWLTDNVYPEGAPHEFHFITGSVFDTLGYVYTLNTTKRPSPSSNSNTIEIPITNQNIGVYYTVKWYNSETGLPYNYNNPAATVLINGAGRKVVSFAFPSYIRDLQNQTINNTFGDAVFVLIKKNVFDKKTDYY